jgi:hypothetical protein
MTFGLRANAPSDRDLIIGADGLLSTVADLEAVAQNCITAMSAQLGEMVLAADEGVPTVETVWDKYHPARFEMAARRTLLAVDGVRDVLSFQQSRSGDTLSYTAEILTAYGRTTVTNIFER